MSVADRTGQHTAKSYPLDWPIGWKRTPAVQRHHARFRKMRRLVREGDGHEIYAGMQSLTMADAITRLQLELDRLGSEHQVLSTNVQTRLDGLPRSGQREPDDPGAAVYFNLHGKDRCLACDRWTKVADNIAAIASHIFAIRAVERYGVGTMDQAFAGYAQLRSGTDEWWLVLGIDRTASAEQIEAAYRSLAKKTHPDAGGSTWEMARLNSAREAARKSVVIAP